MLKEFENGTVKGTYFGLFITLQTPMILYSGVKKTLRLRDIAEEAVLLYAVREVRLRGRPCSGVKTEIRAFGYLVYLPNS